VKQILNQSSELEKGEGNVDNAEERIPIWNMAYHPLSGPGAWLTTCFPGKCLPQFTAPSSPLKFETILRHRSLLLKKRGSRAVAG
jgi:hypothetical protein